LKKHVLGSGFHDAQDIDAAQVSKRDAGCLRQKIAPSSCFYAENEKIKKSALSVFFGLRPSVAIRKSPLTGGAEAHDGTPDGAVG